MSGERYNIHSQLEHLQSKYIGTGHADTTKYDWMTNQVFKQGCFLASFPKTRFKKEIQVLTKLSASRFSLKTAMVWLKRENNSILKGKNWTYQLKNCLETKARNQKFTIVI